MLSTGVDLRPWAGAGVFVTVWPLTVTLDPYTDAGEGLFDDIVDALCGRSPPAGQSVAQYAAAVLAVPIPGSAPWVARIDEDDRVFLEAAVAFEVQLAPAWGFTDAITPAVAVGARWRATAQADWVRGNVEQRIGVRAAAPDPWTYVPQLARVQSIPVALRSTLTSDADQIDQALTVQGADVAAHADSNVRWGIDETGRVWRSWDSTSAIEALFAVWPSFAARLGFTRGWTTVTTGDLVVETAIDPCPGVLCPTRPLAEPVRRSTDVRASTSRSLAGLVRRVERAQLQVWSVQLLLDGLMDLGDDLWDHYLRRWVPYQSRRVVLYQDAGDTRRRGELPVGDAYGLLSTVQDGGRWGRIIGVLDEGHDTAPVLEAQQGLYRRGPATFRIAEVPGA
jgi:hypothetical protein